MRPALPGSLWTDLTEGDFPLMRPLALLTVGLALLAGSPARAADAAAAPAAAAPAPATAAPAKTTRKNSVAIMDTVAQNAPDALAALMTQTISSYAANNLGMDVIAKDDIKKQVSFSQLQQLAGCDGDSCPQAANLGQTLSVEKILTSTLGKIGDRFQLSVVVMDVATGKVTGRGTREIRTEDEIVENARDLAHFAIKNEQRESKGYIRISVPVTGAQIIIDGSAYGVSPLATPARELAGNHTVHVEKKGFLPFDGAVTVEVGKESGVEVKLIPKSEVKLAGAGFLPWAGVTLGLAVAGGALSIYGYEHALSECKQWQLDSAICGQPTTPATLSQLTAAKNDVQLWGNEIAFYGGISSGVLGALSVALWTAYFIAGVGAAGDEPPAQTTFQLAPTLHLTPTGDGFKLAF